MMELVRFKLDFIQKLINVLVRTNTDKKLFTLTVNDQWMLPLEAHSELTQVSKKEL